MEINGTTRVCGLIGHPVEHTASPLIHNTLSLLTGENIAYAAFHVEPEQLEAAIRGAYGLNLLGLNVTIPYKQAVIPYLTQIDEAAKQVGAVNTLVRTEGGFKGYNTDLPGLGRALSYDGVSVTGEDVLVLGAGGVSRAVVMLMLQLGAAGVTICNRSRDRAQELADTANRTAGRPFCRAAGYEELPDLCAGEKRIVFQTTSVGMSPKEGEAPVTDPAFYQQVKVGYDLIFRPARTEFMRLCRQAGARAFNGYRMLLFQGIIAYELWTGRAVTDEEAAKVLRKLEEN